MSASEKKAKSKGDAPTVKKTKEKAKAKVTKTKKFAKKSAKKVAKKVAKKSTSKEKKLTAEEKAKKVARKEKAARVEKAARKAAKKEKAAKKKEASPKAVVKVAPVKLGPPPAASVTTRDIDVPHERAARGFSFGELTSAAIPIYVAKREDLPLDIRRRSIVEANVEMLKGWFKSSADASAQGEAKVAAAASA
jgi:ribosomal protein L13E